MGKTLTFELPDEVYEVLQAEAARTGASFQRLALRWLTHYSLPEPRPVSEAERALAWAAIERHAGSVSSGDPNSADNERIDADLAREYGSTHEEAT